MIRKGGSHLPGEIMLKQRHEVSKPTPTKEDLQERVMRHLISGVVAAVAVMAAAPAMACGYSSCASPCGYSYSPCAQPRYVAPVATYSYGYGCGGGCGSGYGYGYARLAEPTS